MLWIVPFLFLYLTLVLYIGWRTWQWLRLVLPTWYGLLFWPLYGAVASSLLLERLFPPQGFGRLLGHIRNIWLGVFAYALMFVILIDLFRLIRAVFRRIRGKKRVASASRSVQVTGWVACLLVLAIGLYGSWNARRLQSVAYEVVLEQPAVFEQLDIVLLSDLHLGIEMDARRLQPVVEAANQAEPDLVLLAGDLFDGAFAALADPPAIQEMLSRLQATYGVYACLGNHDAGDDLAEKLAFLEQAGIRVLLDEAVEIEDVLLVGRLDRSPIGYQMPRSPLVELLPEAAHQQAVILMDHSPMDLAEVKAQPVDLLVSGHTHRGQIFPGNLITAAVYENDYGYKTFGSLHTVVTSGVGTWGPPWRIASRSEIVKLRVTFSPAQTG